MNHEWCRWMYGADGCSACRSESHSSSSSDPHAKSATSHALPNSSLNQFSGRRGGSKTDSPAFRLGSAAIAAIAPEPRCEKITGEWSHRGSSFTDKRSSESTNPEEPLLLILTHFVGSLGYKGVVYNFKVKTKQSI